MTYHDVEIPLGAITTFCRRYHIERLALFGSILRDDFSPQSDIDVLVEFGLGKTPGLAFFRMQDELSEILGRKVDLNTPGFLSPCFRDAVREEAEVLYDARRPDSTAAAHAGSRPGSLQAGRGAKPRKHRG